MTLDINKPYIFCWIFIPLLTLLGFLSREETIDIQLHDTYFVVGYFHFAMLLSTILALTGFGYWIILKFKGRLNTFLTGVHLTITIAFFFLLIVVIFPSITEASLSKFVAYNKQRWMPNLLWIGFLSFIVAQLLYLLNLTIGLLNR